MKRLIAALLIAASIATPAFSQKISALTTRNAGSLSANSAVWFPVYDAGATTETYRVSFETLGTVLGAGSVVDGDKGDHERDIKINSNQLLNLPCVVEKRRTSNNVSNGASTSAYITTAAISSCSFVGNVGISHTHYLLHDNNVGTTSKCVLVGNSSDGGGFGAVSATFLADCQSYATGNGTTGVVTGSASPESSITAPVGWLYLRTGGGASTTLYVKESGTGNTGWVAK